MSAERPPSWLCELQFSIGRLEQPLRGDAAAMQDAPPRKGISGWIGRVAFAVTVAVGRFVSWIVRALSAGVQLLLAVPLRVFELTGLGDVRTRFDLSQARGLTRFVGRRDELALLETALEQALAVLD